MFALALRRIQLQRSASLEELFPSFNNNNLKSSSSASPWVTLEFLGNKMSCFPLDKSRSVCYGYKCSKQCILTSLSHSSIRLRVVESILQCPVQHIQS